MRLAIAVVIVLVLCVPVAAEPSSRSCPSPSGPAIRGGGCVAGFELGVPPEGWILETTVPTNTWMSEAAGSYEGSYNARIVWQDIEPQDEWMKVRYTPMTDDVLEFATMGSVLWTSNANFYVTVDGTTIWNFLNDHTVASWEWEHVAIPLGAYAGQDIEIGFGYVGQDGADHHLDAVNVHSFDMGVSDVEIVWHSQEAFSIYPTLPISSCLSHDDVTTRLTYAIDSGVVFDQDVIYAGTFYGACYYATYPGCSAGCVDVWNYGGFCTDEYIAMGSYRCRCHWSTAADDATIYAYTGQSNVTVAIDMTRNDVVESDETNNTLTVPLVPPTPVETTSWTTIKGLYR
jgi:hypothetical protein